jgi:hypothetical protein
MTAVAGDVKEGRRAVRRAAVDLMAAPGSQPLRPAATTSTTCAPAPYRRLRE